MSDSAIEDLPFLHEAHIPMRWGDMDGYNHLNNATYFRFLEEARIKYFADTGVVWMEQDIAPVLFKAESTFLLPIEYPATLIIRTYLNKLGSSSVGFSHTISVAGDEQTVYNEAHVVLVWINKTTGKSVAIPDHVRKCFSAKE